MILIPVKNLSAAKQRLASVLDQPSRTELGASHAARCARSTCRVGRAGPACALVTSDPFAIELARQYDFEIIPDPANPGETGAIEMATQFCVERGIDSTLVIPADIPLIQASELDEILQACSRRRLACWCPPPTDAAPTPSSAVPPNLFPLRFGNDSFKPHLAAAQATGKPCVVLRLARNCARRRQSRGLAATCWRMPGETRTQSLIRQWGTDSRFLATGTEGS